jgi:hypothetical protein
MRVQLQIDGPRGRVTVDEERPTIVAGTGLADLLDTAVAAARRALDLPPEDPGAVEDLTEAIRLTVEYVGTDTLPAQDGWSWFEALRRHAPTKARAFIERPVPLGLFGAARDEAALREKISAVLTLYWGGTTTTGSRAVEEVLAVLRGAS